jgi:hypothetical protein
MNPITSKIRPQFGVLLFLSWATTGLASELVTVRYTKEALAKDAPGEFIRQTDLSDVLSSKLKGLALTMTARQGGSNVAILETVKASSELSKSRWLKKLSTLAVSPSELIARGDENRLRSNLAAQYRKSMEINFKQSFPVIERLQRGLNFSLDMSNPGTTLRRNAVHPQIRYGLVESDILPAVKTLPVASSQTLSEMDYEYATPAQVIYTIDRIDHDGPRAVFSEVSMFDNDQMPSSSIWSKMPSSSIKVKIDAADTSTAMSDQVSRAGPIPGMRLTFTQADGLITTQVVASGADSRKSMVTEMRAPLYGAMSVARKFNYKMLPTETSAQNILGDAEVALVNVVYTHTSKRFRGEWGVKRNRFEYNVVAEPRQGWGSDQDSQLGKVGDKISLSMNTSF